MPFLLLSLLLTQSPAPSETVEEQVERLFDSARLEQTIAEELDSRRDSRRRALAVGPHAGMGLHQIGNQQFDTSVKVGLGLSVLAVLDDFELSPVLLQKVSKQVKARLSKALEGGQVPSREEARAWAREEALQVKIKYLAKERESIAVATPAVAFQMEVSQYFQTRTTQLRLLGSYGVWKLNVGWMAGLQWVPGDVDNFIFGIQASTKLLLSELDRSNMLEPYIAVEGVLDPDRPIDTHIGFRYTFDLI